jgi:hypothetical protein
LLVYPTDRAAYGRLCRLLTIGKARAGKGKCSLFLDDVVAWSEGLIAILVTDKPSGELPQQLKRICILVEAVTDYAIYMLDPKGIVSSWAQGASKATSPQRSSGSIFPISTPVGKEWFEGLLRELTDKFGGATSFMRSPGKGLWQSGGETESDTIAVIEVMADGIDPDYWRSLRKRLERELSQEEIVIRAQEISLL